MKSIFFLQTMLMCTTVVFAQSSVTDVPAVKEVNAPVKIQQPVISSVIAITPVTSKKGIVNDNSGSLMPVPAQKNIVTPVDNTGSVAPVFITKHQPTAVPADVKNSTNSIPIIPATRIITISTVPNSTNTTIPVQAPVQPVGKIKGMPVQVVKVVATPFKPVIASVINVASVQQDLLEPTDISVGHLPQIILNPAKPVQLETVPMTVINPAAKVPLVSVKAVKPKSKE